METEINFFEKIFGKPFTKRFVFLVLLFVIIIFLIIMNATIWAPPKNFPKGEIYNAKFGKSYTNIGNDLKNMGVIKSVYWFKGFTYIWSFGERRVIAGPYLLDENQSVWALAKRFSYGDYRVKSIKVTIPEGLNSKEIADIFEKNLNGFNKENFLTIVNKSKLEGYLFPDTYLILPGTDEGEIINLMNINYGEKIKSISDEIKKFGRPVTDVIKMASIIEGEARLFETRQIVSGILWKRLDMKMALQVDSTFKYINGKTTRDLTLEDLKISSPYNSYTNLGLPPTPISNPGLEAIRATINPIKTKYFYFLTDNDGNMHYAVTHDEHVANKQKYLK